MKNYLNILLVQMEMPEEQKSFFENGVLERIKSNHFHYCFEITLEKLLPPYVSELFLVKLAEAFAPTSVIARFKIRQIEEQKVIEYYKYFLDHYSREIPSLGILKDYKAEYQNGILTIVVGNKVEQKKLEDLEDNFLRDFSKVGIEISMIVNINSEINEQTVKEIEASKIVSIQEEIMASPVSEPEIKENSKKKLTFLIDQDIKLRDILIKNSTSRKDLVDDE